MAKLSPVFNEQRLTADGRLAVGYRLHTWSAGTQNKLVTFTDAAEVGQHSNPIVLNANGEPPSAIYLQTSASYRFGLAANTDVEDPPQSLIRDIDNIQGINDIGAIAVSEWIASNLIPTYVSSTSFTLAGDQTTAFHVGRRLKSTVTAGTAYSTISLSVFTTVTTVTVVNTQGALDSGLSAVAYGIISSTNTSQPIDDASIIKATTLTPTENLTITRASVSTVTITADTAAVRNLLKQVQILTTVSLTANIASSGANGLDTGSEAASTWYYLFVIWNGATAASLLSLSQTAPTLPTGYTHSGLVGAARNDSASNIIAFTQHDDVVAMPEQAILTNGSATAVTALTLLGNFVPPNVWRVFTQVRIDATAGTLVDGSLWVDAAGTSRALRIGVASVTDTAPAVSGAAQINLLTSQGMWYSVSAASGILDIDIIGFGW